MISTSPQRSSLFVLDSALQAEKEYWAGRLSASLAGDLEPGVLAPDKPGGTWRYELPAELAQRLEKVSGGSPLLRFAVLTAGLAACLTRWNGRRQVLLASPALAAHPEPNAVALLVEVDPERSFRQQLLATRDVLREAYSHQRYPWPRLAQELEAPPLRMIAALDGLHGPVPAGLGCDLEIVFASSGGRLAVEVRSGTLQRFLARFAAGLSAALRDVEKPLRTLDWLSEPERHQLLHEWPDGADAAPADCLHRLVAAQAAATPDHVAVIDPALRLTYRELERRANRLAQQLISLGIGPESRVGVLLERSCGLAVALLGVLKAGAAYVPLDPSLPGERLRFLFDDSRAALLLTRSGLPALDVPSLRIDEVDGEADDPAIVVSPDHLAYVIYTSGSTGRPKGVMIPHRGLTTYLRWCAEAYEVAAGEGAPVHTSIGFDLTVTSLWSPLVCGRPVRMLPGDSPAEALADARAGGFALSLAKITPAHLELLLGTLPDPSLAAGVRVWVLGGEALRGELLAPWLESAPGTRWINEYGPTETVVGCCVHQAGPADTGVVPIGRPIAGAVLRLLAPDLSPVPPGETGELYIGGAGVARGYWDRPALTAERFVPDPCAETPGARLYRTGDLAVHRPDGVLVYLGRQDGQVKIRGHRIEPAEIESVLVRHPAIRSAAVIAREDVPGQKRLVAYVVPAGAAAPAHAELRAHAAASLPEPMVPAAFVVLRALPLTPNGKVDRNALPAPVTVRSEEKDAPLRPLEEILGGIWADVLGVEYVGRGDDFFAFGGHSLLAAQVVSRLRRTLDVELPLRTLFEAPALDRFAAAVEVLRGVRSTGTVPLERSDGPRELSPGQERVWFFHQLETSTAAYNVASALRLQGDLAVAALERGLAEVARRHEVLRSAFPAESGLPVWTLAPPGLVALPRIDLGGLPEPLRRREEERVGRDEAGRPFDLGRGPLLRVLLLALGPREHLLVVVMHHIVSDGWSMTVLTRELTEAYAAAVEGRAARWPELPVRFADFARWQRRLLAADEGHLEYWRSRLAGAPLLSTFPPDRRGDRAGMKGAQLPVELPAELSAAVRALGRRQGTTVFMLLLAAFAVVLRHATGQDDLVVGTDLANRGRVEVEDLIGFFVNQLPLRLDLSRDPAFTELLARVRESALGAYDHQQAPFGLIVDALKLDRTLKVPPLFQVKLVVQSFPQGAFAAPGLVAAPVFLDSGTAQLDLMLALEDEGAELRGWILYSTALFEETTVRDLFERFRLVLEATAAQPETRLSALEGALARRSRQQAVRKEGGFSRFKKVQSQATSPLE